MPKINKQYTKKYFKKFLLEKTCNKNLTRNILQYLTKIKAFSIKDEILYDYDYDYLVTFRKKEVSFISLWFIEKANSIKIIEHGIDPRYDLCLETIIDDLTNKECTIKNIIE